MSQDSQPAVAPSTQLLANPSTAMSSRNGQPKHLKSSTTFIPPTFGTVEAFQNANLVHQKRLKVNSSVLTKCRNDFNQLKEQYKQMITHPPSIPSHRRKEVFKQLTDLCERYNKLLENRRDTHQIYSEWLEQALDVPQICATDELLGALEMHEHETRSLVKLTAEPTMDSELVYVANLSSNTTANKVNRPTAQSVSRPPPLPIITRANRNSLLPPLSSRTDLFNATSRFLTRIRPSQSHLDRGQAPLEALITS